MESWKLNVIFQGKGTYSDIYLKEVARGFTLPTLPLINLEHVGDFKQEWETQINIRAHRRAFSCDPTNKEVMSWIEF